MTILQTSIEVLHVNSNTWTQYFQVSDETETSLAEVRIQMCVQWCETELCLLQSLCCCSSSLRRPYWTLLSIYSAVYSTAASSRLVSTISWKSLLSVTPKNLQVDTWDVSDKINWQYWIERSSTSMLHVSQFIMQAGQIQLLLMENIPLLTLFISNMILRKCSCFMILNPPLTCESLNIFGAFKWRLILRSRQRINLQF